MRPVASDDRQKTSEMPNTRGESIRQGYETWTRKIYIRLLIHTVKKLKDWK
jgi:hypothetical protein